MTEKLLHEKKISELIIVMNKDDPFKIFKQEWLTFADIKEWAISVVKNCKNTTICLVGNDEFKNVSCGDERMSGKYCEPCKFLIKRFELTEEELK